MMHQFVCPEVVLHAVQWLVDNNPLYPDMNIALPMYRVVQWSSHLRHVQ